VLFAVLSFLDLTASALRRKKEEEKEVPIMLKHPDAYLLSPCSLPASRKKERRKEKRGGGGRVGRHGDVHEFDSGEHCESERRKKREERVEGKKKERRKRK